MSERITAANLDEVIKWNEVIEEQMKQSASLIWSKYNPMQINSPIQLALQILRPYGLIQLPIDNHYLSGAIFVRDGKRIPLINTALPRANQYFTAWHEIYHLLFDEVSFDHLIESEILMEERKAEYFAALMLLGNLMPYFEGLKDMEFQAKAFQCMNAFQAPYKAVLISLYESAVKNNFMEVHSACLLAQELNCPAFVGEFRFEIPEQLRSKVIRPDNLKEVMDCVMDKKLLEAE